MASRSSTIKVSVIGDAKDLQRTFNETASGAEKWAGNMKRAGGALTLGLTTPIVAGAGLAIRAASEEAAEMEGLADTIRKRIPEASDAMISSNEEWVSNLQNSIAVADGEIRGLEQRFLSAGSSVEEAQRLTAAAYDVSAQTGKDATAIAEALVKAQNGSMAGLAKLGIETENAAGETMDFNEILGDLEDKMGGSAAAAADTAAGRAEKLKNTTADLAESFGMILLPIMEKVVGWLQRIADWFSNLGPAGQKVVLVVAGIAAAIGPLLLGLGKVIEMGPTLIKGFEAVGKAWSVLSKAFMANPWILLIAAIVALVVIIVMNWDHIKEFLLKTWEVIKATAKAVWDWIKNTISSIVTAISNFFAKWNIAALVMENWKKLKAGVETLKVWITSTWDSIVSFFRGLPTKISSAVSGMWNGIKDAFRSAINWIIDKWNSLKLTIGPLTIPSWIPGIGGKEIKMTVGTPNIPRLHGGGVFRAPFGAGEGLALLRDRELVLPPGAGARGAAATYNIVVNAGMGANGQQIGRQIVEELQRYERSNGPIPVGTRAS